METKVLELSTGTREIVVDITDHCAEFLGSIGAIDGLLHVFVPHATAGVAVVETGSGTDTDLLAILHHLLPADERWQHSHGAKGHGRDHVLPALLAPYAVLPVVGGELALGTWQSVCLVDTNVDNPRRSLRLSFLPG